MKQGDTVMPALRPSDAMTVVIIPLVGGATLRACLEAINSQHPKAILIVAREAFNPPVGVRLIAAPAGSSVPERRMIGLMAATTPFVAFIEDTCLAWPDWATALCTAFSQADVLAAGGPVRIGASLAPRMRALAIGEYSRFSESGKPAASDVEALAGANFALRRAAFVSEAQPNGLVDNLVFEAVRKGSGRLRFQPGAGVTYAAGPAEHARLSTRFHHGRIYGGMLAARRPLASRLALALTALAAPAVLIARNLRHAGPELLLSPSTLWWLVLMHCAWGCGEVVGKLTGEVGSSFKGWA